MRSIDYSNKKGFALPTVLIASIVLLSILAVAIAATASVRSALKDQYYAQLAQVAGEAGVSYAKACLAQNGNVPLWDDNKPLKPSTDCMGNEVLTPAVKALIVAGGGSGGSGTGGGGGGGGVIYNESIPISAGSYSVVVGAGGAAPPQQTTGNSGGNSSFAGLTAIGGGGGAHSGTGSNSAGKNGGSGGGSQSYNSITNPGQGTAGQGYAGGTGISNSGTTGGGGAGGVGLTLATTYGGGAGGPGISNSISGNMLYYGGGGGGAAGGSNTQSPGGVGGGGRGGLEATAGEAGSPNTGGGGGGGWNHAGGLGGAGGSGIVVIAYPINSGISATGGTITQSGPYKIHTFTGNGTFSVSDAGQSSCPDDVRCYVFSDENVRSSFSVPAPTVDGNGQAVAVAHSGYVEVLRTSSNTVWKTYRQPSVQASVIPELCSGATSGSLGWSRAVIASTQDSFAPSSAAKSISISNGNISAGSTYYRRDFSIVDSGSYKLYVHTPASRIEAKVHVDGQLVTTVGGSLKEVTLPLDPGCHNITVQLTNKTIKSEVVRFTASLQRSSQSPSVIIATDASWYVSAGQLVHFSDPDYYIDPSKWDPAFIVRAPADLTVGGFASASGDVFANTIATPVGVPTWPAGVRYYRDGKDVIVNSATTVKVTSVCDDLCDVYMDGQKIHNTYWNLINSTIITLQPGRHHFGVALKNNAAGATSMTLSVVETDTGKALTRSDSRWIVSSLLDSDFNQHYSYDDTFRPSPESINEAPTAEVLVVAGGGGGAGNCTTCGGAGGGGGGGLLYNDKYTLSVGSTSVVIGAGGARGAVGSNSSTGQGSNGGNSSFGSMIAIGGGGGRPQNGVAGGGGGSGGGGSGGSSPAPGSGGAGTVGQGNNGGAGVTSPYGGGGGGGAAGVGLGGSYKHGGAGWVLGITGTMVGYGGGGGGGAYNTEAPGLATAGGGNGNNIGGDANGFSATPNTGGGGGGANGYYRGGQGGLGGSGVVIIAYKTGTVVATGGTITTANGYTIHTFNSNGTFTVVSIP